MHPAKGKVQPQRKFLSLQICNMLGLSGSKGSWKHLVCHCGTPEEAVMIARAALATSAAELQALNLRQHSVITSIANTVQ